MSVARPARCLLSKTAASVPRPSSVPSAPRCLRTFHNTPVPHSRRKPKFPSVKAEDMRKIQQEAAEAFPAYTDAEKALLAHKYTPEQIAAIEAAEKAIPSVDIAIQGGPRQDVWRVTYPEDFSRIKPIIDKVPRKELNPLVDYTMRPKTDEESADTLAEFFYEQVSRSNDFFTNKLENAGDQFPDEDLVELGEGEGAKLLETQLSKLPEEERKEAERALEGVGEEKLASMSEEERKQYITPEEIEAIMDRELEKIDENEMKKIFEEELMKDDEDIFMQETEETLNFMLNPRLWVHAKSEEAYKALEDPGLDSKAPELPKLTDPAVSYMADHEEEDPHITRLMRQTGLDQEQIRKLRVKNLVRHRVVNQTRMGKIQSQYYLTIAGNQNGMLGVGEGKAGEAEDASRQALMNAIRNMKPIPRYENRTIYGDIEGKVGATEVKLFTRPPGFGLRTQHLIFEMARAAGIQDLAARVPRSRNKMNTVKATWQALLGQRLPEDIARGRGRKLVDVRKVYYGGKVF